MSVYVDSMLDCLSNNKWKYSQACHMIADTEGELLTFAKKIGLKPRWIQRKPGFLHFDLTISKRELAVKNGAIELNRKEFCLKRKEVTR